MHIFFYSWYMKQWFWIWEDEKTTKIAIKKGDRADQKSVGQIALDIIETDYDIMIFAPIAGVSLEDIDVTFSEWVLTLSGHRNQPDIYTDPNIDIKSSECFWGPFVRNIILPDNLDFDNISAAMENNLLHITIQKLQFTSQNIKIDRIEL